MSPVCSQPSNVFGAAAAVRPPRQAGAVTMPVQARPDEASSVWAPSAATLNSFLAGLLAPRVQTTGRRGGRTVEGA
jgi:hypothetical protein